MGPNLTMSISDEIEQLLASHATEVRLLEQRVRELERALVEATNTTGREQIMLAAAPAFEHSGTGTESRLPTAEEIAAARRANAAACVWVDDEASFEEKVAARAFFGDDGNETPSRRWLLGSR